MPYYKLSQLPQLTDLALDSESDVLTTAVSAAPTVYGLTATIATELASSYSLYNTALQSLLAADIEYRKAVQAKISARDTLLGKYQTFLPMCYANPTVTNDELAALGLAPKPTRGGLVPVYVPLELTVTTIANNAAANLKWKRNGNTNSTVYVIEKQVEDGAWEIVWSGTRTRVELQDCPAGVEASFRVVATKADMRSNYSNTATIYHDGSTAQLRVAA